ncbi:hypothetical protein LJC42_03700 [Eubacteriales bacterium OttesenSCG-928-K08]|nr:hypothetical protein [Eubacteriales bacterium OttesenSCG-928-K08]
MSNTQNPHNLRIFTIITQIEQYLDEAPKPKLGTGDRRLVDSGVLFDLLGDLKVTVPEDIRRANSILIEADELMDRANQDAIDMVEQAQREVDELHQQAQAHMEQMRFAAEREFEERVAQDKVQLEVARRCELLQQRAEHNANMVYNGAKEYADAILQDIQRYLMEYHQMVRKNRDELGVATSQPVAAPQQAIYQQPLSQPVEPPVDEPIVEPKAAEFNTKQFEDDFEEQAPRRKRSLFRRNEEPDDFLAGFDDEQIAQPEEKPTRRGIRRRDVEEELDLDLDE